MVKEKRRKKVLENRNISLAVWYHVGFFFTQAREKELWKPRDELVGSIGDLTLCHYYMIFLFVSLAFSHVCTWNYSGVDKKTSDVDGCYSPSALFIIGCVKQNGARLQLEALQCWGGDFLLSLNPLLGASLWRVRLFTWSGKKFSFLGFVRDGTFWPHQCNKIRQACYMRSRVGLWKGDWRLFFIHIWCLSLTA